MFPHLNTEKQGGNRNLDVKAQSVHDQSGSRLHMVARLWFIFYRYGKGCAGGRRDWEMATKRALLGGGSWRGQVFGNS